MSDRELLELAAKAAGLKPPMPMHGPGLTWGHGWWNPLTDDGDALRLAVKLRINIDWETFDVVWADNSGEQGDDPYAATRRAIVRAAAEIGRSMK